jgi:hypothetical protein
MSKRSKTSRRSPGPSRLAKLKARLEEVETTLEAIRSGAVDALVVAGANDPSFASIPVVVISANAEQGGRRIDANAVIAKPVDFDQLLKTIDAHTRDDLPLAPPVHPPPGRPHFS